MKEANDKQTTNKQQQSPHKKLNKPTSLSVVGNLVVYLVHFIESYVSHSWNKQAGRVLGPLYGIYFISSKKGMG
jgi:hypothetical protein